MKHRVPLFLRFLRSVLLVLLSWQFLCVVPVVVSSVGCMSAETPELVQASNPKAPTFRICVLPKSLPPDTKVFATDANRSVFVSDRDPEAFRDFLPLADTTFQFDPFARPSSALLLGTALHLSCPETFDVLRAPEDVEEGESRYITVIRIPTETHRELRSIVEQTCKTAALEGSDRRYVGQQNGKPHTILLGRSNPQFSARVAALLGLNRIPEPEPSGPRSVTQQLIDTPQGQQIGGTARGITKAVIPGGTIAVDLAREAHWLLEGTRAARIAEHSAELGVGVIQIAVGCTGIVAGTGLTGTGGGAPAGVPVLVGSFVLTSAGVVNVGNSIRHLTIELWRTDEGDSLGSSSPPSESSAAESAPQSAKPTAAPAPAATPAPTAEAAKLEPYRKPGGGHHVPSKKAFEGAPGYNPRKAPAIPNKELKRLGEMNHNKITTEQMKAYKAFAETGQPLTWDAIAKIETDALVVGGMKLDMAKATVDKAIQLLKDAGVAAPVRIPWGGK